MPTVLFIPVGFLMGLVLFALAGKWYYWSWARRAPLKDAATPLLLLHAGRYIGLAFLIPGLVSPLLDSRFTTDAAYGDLTAALLALLALAALRLNLPGKRPLLWVFNLEGCVDLLLAMGLGARYASPELLQAAYFIPVVGVPLLLVTHFVLFGLLLRRESGALE
jgi:hypothetical protein